MIADKIRAILLDADNRNMQPLTELLLYIAARTQHVSDVIAPALHTGSVVLCDRFTDATMAYQHNGRGIDRAVIEMLNSLACRSIRPDLTVLIDCDVAAALGRARSRIEGSSGPREERFELEELSFHQRVRAGYLEQAAREPERFLIIDGSGTVDEVSNAVSAGVGAFIKDKTDALC